MSLTPPRLLYVKILSSVYKLLPKTYNTLLPAFERYFVDVPDKLNSDTLTTTTPNTGDIVVVIVGDDVKMITCHVKYNDIPIEDMKTCESTGCYEITLTDDMYNWAKPVIPRFISKLWNDPISVYHEIARKLNHKIVFDGIACTVLYIELIGIAHKKLISSLVKNVNVGDNFVILYETLMLYDAITYELQHDPIIDFIWYNVSTDLPQEYEYLFPNFDTTLLPTPTLLVPNNLPIENWWSK